MGYFTYIADTAFKTGYKGEYLFFLGGPWSKPLTLMDEQQRDRTYAKHLWVQRIFLSTLILGQPFLFLMVPEITGKIIGFFGYLAIISIIQWAVQRIVFRTELRTCKRINKRLPFTSFYQQMSDKHSSVGLCLGFLGCIAFVACGIWIASSSLELSQRVIGIFGSLLSGVFGLVHESGSFRTPLME